MLQKFREIVYSALKVARQFIIEVWGVDRILFTFSGQLNKLNTILVVKDVNDCLGMAYFLECLYHVLQVGLSRDNSFGSDGTKTVSKLIRRRVWI